MKNITVIFKDGTSKVYPKKEFAKEFYASRAMFLCGDGKEPAEGRTWAFGLVLSTTACRYGDNWDDAVLKEIETNTIIVTNRETKYELKYENCYNIHTDVICGMPALVWQEGDDECSALFASCDITITKE